MSVPDPPATTSTGRSGTPAAWPPRDRPNDVDLPSLLVDLLEAKNAVANDVPQARNRPPTAGRVKLLACMEAYSAALTARRLPIPPRLRDDLRLHRALYFPDAERPTGVRPGSPVGPPSSRTRGR